MAVVEGKNPKIMVKEAIAWLGDMDKYVREGEIVVIKPNITWDRLPEQVVNTNSEVVSTLVKVYLQAEIPQLDFLVSSALKLKVNKVVIIIIL